ncbi:MAG TPA: hypothetical protein PK082_08005 [Phycisphaerae bacterium]|nr:hypothetical protein [Phycisphaerae bacterium]
MSQQTSFEDNPQTPSLREEALQAARAGLDFLVRHQQTASDSADQGRFPFTYDAATDRITSLSTNWTTGISVEALLAGHLAFGGSAYADAARRAVRYLASLQYDGPERPRVLGVFREVTPQSGMAHPRDALTAAWALFDWARLFDDAEALARARRYADWFVSVGMEKGYPYWTVRFDDQPWEPAWCGSFHSGSAFFLARMHEFTRDGKYRDAMRAILEFYNARHLDARGKITVILDRESLESLDGRADPRYSNPGWERMHVYNDDFGALANLAAWKLTGDEGFLRAAERFLKRMLTIQRADGGFGPAEGSVPSAGGAVLIELLAARRVGFDWARQDPLDRAARYLMGLQIRRPGAPADGGFRGFTGEYTLSETAANVRAGAYAILALLRYAGQTGPNYFLE